MSGGVWILVLLLRYAGAPAAVALEFSSRERCELARSSIVTQSKRAEVAICVEK